MSLNQPSRTAEQLREPTLAFLLAHAMLEGFNKHYRLFRAASTQANELFDQADWAALQQMTTERISYYDLRAAECAEQLIQDFKADEISDEVWQQTKLEYILLLTSHRQPELAETFFNTVFIRVSYRPYYQSDLIFVRPGVSTEHIDADPPAYRCYYPLRDGLRHSIRRILEDMGFKRPFKQLKRDIRRCLSVLREHLPQPLTLEANHQIQVLSSLFYRNTSAYIVGRIINGGQLIPFVVAVMHAADGGLEVDNLLLTTEELSILVNSSRAYFLVDMEVPSATVRFLQSMLPQKPKAELYSILGLQKQGKTLFYRDFLHHLSHSSDDFIIAPGIKGLVMTVFTLPSYPYVFKVIKDVISPPKQINKDQVKEKYHLVKTHDRVGRMADTLEYSNVGFPRDRFTPELLEELRRLAPSMIEESGNRIIVRHLYIERRMVPLNMYIDRGIPEQVIQSVREFGNALRELAAVNIFAGDLLFKNFGVTRYGRVVFYDYDEIDYITNINFRKIPAPRNEEDELAAEPWYSVNPNDVFPEEFAQFLLTDPVVRQAFMEYHADLLDYRWWQAMQEELRAGRVGNVIPYNETDRFSVRFSGGVPHGHFSPQVPLFTGGINPAESLVGTRKKIFGRFSLDSD
jgi:isocitrate dehydrogenase kinase/phosphatase